MSALFPQNQRQTARKSFLRLFLCAHESLIGAEKYRVPLSDQPIAKSQLKYDSKSLCHLSPQRESFYTFCAEIQNEHLKHKSFEGRAYKPKPPNAERGAYY